MLSDNIVMNNGVVAGDVGVGVGVGAGLFVQNDAFIQANPPTYTGTAYFQGAVNCSGAGCPSNVAGGTQAFTGNVTTAINDYNNLVTTLEGLTGATSLGAFSGGTLTPGLYDATSLNLSDATTSSLTLDAGGNPNAQFVIRVPNLNVTGTGSIYLTNGAQPDNVIILEENSQNENWNSTGTFNGILLDGDPSTADRFTFTSLNPSSTGRVVYINGGIVIGNSASGTIFGPQTTPEPSTFGLVVLGLVIVIFRQRAQGAWLLKCGLFRK
jgi:hypothetical protein